MVFINEHGEQECQNCHEILEGPLGMAHDFVNDCPFCRSTGPSGAGLIPTEKLEPIVREQPKIGRNDLCPCGSKKKFKKCCAS